MDGSALQRILGILDAKETCGLFECLVAESVDFSQLVARSESTVLIAIGNDAERELISDAGDVLEQVDGSGVQIHTDTIDAGFDRGFETVLQLLLVDIMLVLSN